MMRISLFLFLLLPFSLTAFDLKEVRREFYAAVNDKKMAENFYDKLRSQNLSSPLMIAYYGSAQAVLAKHAWNPYRKIEYLKSGLAELKRAVSKSPDNLEIRFLRFSIEYYLPSFLGMSKHLDEDGKKMLELIERGETGIDDIAVVKNIVDFLRKSGRYDSKEIAILNTAIKNG